MSKVPKRPEHLQHKKMPQKPSHKPAKAKRMTFSSDGVSETLHCMLQPDDYLRLGDPVRSARGFGGQDTAVMKLECSTQLTIPLKSAPPAVAPTMVGEQQLIPTNTLCLIAFPTAAFAAVEGVSATPSIGYYTNCFDQYISNDGSTWSLGQQNMVSVPLYNTGTGLALSDAWLPIPITLNQQAFNILGAYNVDQRLVGGFLRFAYPTVQTQATVANCFVSDTGPDGMLPLQAAPQQSLIPMTDALGNCRRTTTVESTYEEPGALIRYVGQAGSADEFYTPATFASLFADQSGLNAEASSAVDRLRRQLREGLARLSSGGTLSEAELDTIIDGTGEVADAVSPASFLLTPQSETCSGMFISSADGTQTITGVVTASFQVEYVQNRQISGELHPTIPLDRFAGVQSLSLNSEFATGPHSFKSFLKSAWSGIKKAGKWIWGNRKEIERIAGEVAKLAA